MVKKGGNIVNELDKIKDYFVGLQFFEGKILITAKFDPLWVIQDGDYKIENKGSIRVAQQTNDPLKYFLGLNDTIELSDIINLIEKILESNLTEQRKINLFNMKVNELRNLINELTLEEFESLRFKYKTEKKKFIKETSNVNIETPSETSINDLSKETQNIKKIKQ